MKKSLIALLAVATASVVQAAAVDWSATGSSSVQGFTAYLVLDGDLPAAINSVSDITGVASDSASIVKDGRTYWTKNQTLDGLDTSTYSSGDDITYSIFLVGAKDGKDYYYNLGSVTATVYNDLSNPPESANSNGKVSDTSVPAVGGTGWVSPQPVPEPTSVALLALGLAALGLKRKVA